MPTLDGGATVDHLRKLNPEIKVLLFYGRMKCGCGRSSVNITIEGYLHKPLRKEEAQQLIRQIFPARYEPVAST